LAGKEGLRVLGAVGSVNLADGGMIEADVSRVAGK
jgi:hypothetical protein